jgi:hypothetical protein
VETPMNDKQQILQAVLDSERMSAYFHLDEFPERAPLRVLSGPWFEAGMSLTKFNQPVQFTIAADAEGPLFEVLSLEVVGMNAHVRFRYAPEGIFGDATLAKRDTCWKVVSLTITEH